MWSNKRQKSDNGLHGSIANSDQTELFDKIVDNSIKKIASAPILKFQVEDLYRIIVKIFQVVTLSRQTLHINNGNFTFCKVEG